MKIKSLNTHYKTTFSLYACIVNTQVTHAFLYQWTYPTRNSWSDPGSSASSPKSSSAKIQINQSQRTI